MMWKHWLMTAILLCSAEAFGANVTIVVNDTTCNKTTNVRSYDHTTLKYHGSWLNTDPCKYEFTTGDWNEQICVKAIAFDLPCNKKILYSGGSYPYNYTDKTFKCGQPQTLTWCTAIYPITASIIFESDSSSGVGSGGTTELKIYAVYNYEPTVYEDHLTPIFIILGCSIGGAVLLIIIVIVVVCCVCNRRRVRTGRVYHSQQPPTVTTVMQATSPPTAYPYQPQAGYQQHPPQQGFSTGYQQASQPLGYQSGFQQPPPQDQGAGCQSSTTIPEKLTQDSAHPASE